MTDYRTAGDREVMTHVETAAFEPMTVIDLNAAASEVTETYRNFVVVNVNDHCVRMAVMQGEYRWHHHPESAECFVVLEGLLEIDLAGGRTVHVGPGQAFSIPAGVVHRTRSAVRTVNLCFEDTRAYTHVTFTEPPASS